MFKCLKKTVPIILVLAVVLSGCGKSENSGNVDTGTISVTDPNSTNDFNDGGDIVSDNFADYVTDLPQSIADVEPTSIDDFIDVMKLYGEMGDACRDLQCNVQGSYYSGYAGASISSLRYAVEYVLWLKGEGEKLVDFTSDSLFSGWDEIANIGYMSPYPYFFEGLIYAFQGENAKAAECYAVSEMMEYFPVEGINFGYLKDESIDSLYNIRDRLREVENSIYAHYVPETHGVERCYELGFTGNLLDLAAGFGNEKDFVNALKYSKIALQNNPFEETCWSSAATNALFCGYLRDCSLYIEEGMVLFPESERLKALKELLAETVSGGDE